MCPFRSLPKNQKLKNLDSVLSQLILTQILLIDFYFWLSQVLIKATLLSPATTCNCRTL